MSIEASYTLDGPIGPEPGTTGEETEIEGLTPEALAHVTTHVQQGVARLLYQFQGKPRIETLLEIYLQKVQEIEDVLWSMFNDRWLEVATGTTLDNLGSIVGQARDGFDDETYRVWIGVRIKINLSDGQPEQVLEILRLMLGDEFAMDIRETYPAGFVCTLHDQLTLDPQVPFKILSQTKPVSVELWLDYTEFDPEETFMFAAGDDETPSTTQGFGDEDDPDVGGRWADSLS